jgi:hypothetical protein
MSCYGWAHVMLWVGIGGHRLLLMVMVWVWVQIRRKMFGLCRDQIQTIYALCAQTFDIDTPVT